jgi:hypothetical protein
MQLITLPKRVHPLKSFIHRQARLAEAGSSLGFEVIIESRESSQRDTQAWDPGDPAGNR